MSTTSSGPASPTLPPGQRRVDGFPRFGTHLHRPPPAVPDSPSLELTGAGIEPVVLPLSRLSELPRREQTSDFHCVAGWSATGLRWGGVGFGVLYRDVIEPLLPATTAVTHIGAVGLDGYRAVIALQDALAEEVLVADRLDGRPLDGDHGAPVRLVSPGQYGFMSTKHLCRIELHTSAPVEDYRSAGWSVRAGLRGPIRPHPRARVWREERHPQLPAWAVRPVYARLIAPIRLLCARGSRWAQRDDAVAGG
jgi:DMSO/TMAO reductase YedYZ molybdopterin-dependent catalytic subunit